MGLEEKRLLNMHKEETLPKYTKELEKIAGCKISVELNWDSIADNKEALLNIENQGLARVNSVFRDICIDNVGKNSVKEIKKIKFNNVADGSKKKINISNGVVQIDAAWGNNGYFTESEIKAALEEAL